MVKGLNSLAVNPPGPNSPMVPRAYREITRKAMESEQKYMSYTSEMSRKLWHFREIFGREVGTLW